MTGPCFFLLISAKACQMLDSFNQDSCKALFCNDGGSLKFAVAILDLYFLCYLKN